MSTPIVFTIPELFGAILAVCGAISVVAGAIAVVANGITKMKAPNRAQNERLDKHEEWLKKHDALLDKDNKRLNQLEQSNNLTMKALLALLRHSIDGNDTDSLKKVSGELEEYLIDR